MVNVAVNGGIGVPLLLILIFGGLMDIVASVAMGSFLLFPTGAMVMVIGLILAQAVPMSKIPTFVPPQTKVNTMTYVIFTLAALVTCIIIGHSLLLKYADDTTPEDTKQWMHLNHVILFLLMLCTTLLVVFGSGVNPYPQRREVLAYVLSNGSLSLTPPRKV